MDSEAELLARARRYSFRARMDSKSQRGEIAGPVFVSGQGSEVEDVTGKRWLDFNSGQMCAALGHNHPTVTAAIREACDTLIHAHSSYFNVQEIRLAERLARVMPEGLEKSLFLQSGSDANEAAVMIARQYTGGYEVASPHVSFHGLSDTARSLTFAGWHKEHGPLPSGSQAIVAPYCYRCPLRQTFPACNYACLDTSFELIDAQSTGRPAAVLTEPLFSAGGVIEPPPGWLKRLQELCSARGMLLILDEEQTGLGKLGTMFACDAEGVVPDMITVAKHFGGGISISAVTTSAAIEEKVVESGFINTHSLERPARLRRRDRQPRCHRGRGHAGEGARNRRPLQGPSRCLGATLRANRGCARAWPPARHRAGRRSPCTQAGLYARPGGLSLLL